MKENGVNMIIGYYGQSFFGGGYYYKISKNKVETKYKFEMCHSEDPNDVPKGDKFIERYDTIKFSEEDKKMNNKLVVKSLEKEVLIDQLIKYVKSIDLEKLSKKKYEDLDILDGENWSFYIEYEDNRYYIEGYENKPKEIENVLIMLYEIGERYTKNSFNGILGLAIGDAMGVPIEFVKREKLLNNPVTEMKGFGSHNVPKGTWSDDTAMTLATIDSIKNTGEIDYSDIANNFLKWFREAAFTANGEVFDIGRTTLHALAKYEENLSNPTSCGEDSEFSNGNGSLMRILPIAYYCYWQGRKS